MFAAWSPARRSWWCRTDLLLGLGEGFQQPVGAIEHVERAFKREAGVAQIVDLNERCGGWVVWVAPADRGRELVEGFLDMRTGWFKEWVEGSEVAHGQASPVC